MKKKEKEQKHDWGAELQPIVDAILSCDRGLLTTEPAGREHISKESVETKHFPRLELTISHTERHDTHDGADAEMVFSPQRDMKEGISYRLYGSLKHLGSKFSFLVKKVRKLKNGNFESEHQITFAL